MADVIQIGEVRFKRKGWTTCPHRHLAYSENEQSVECVDCKEPIGAFKAFIILLRAWNSAHESLDTRRREVMELEARCNIGLLKATTEVDKAWRRRNLVPCCPHCHKAIFPSDGFGGSLTNRKLALAARKNGHE